MIRDICVRFRISRILMRRAFELDCPHQRAIRPEHAQLVAENRLIQIVVFNVGSETQLMSAILVQRLECSVYEAFLAVGPRCFITEKVTGIAVRRNQIGFRSQRRTTHVIGRAGETRFDQIAVDDELVFDRFHQQSRALVNRRFGRI